MFYSTFGFGTDECKCLSLFVVKLPQTLKNEKGGLQFQNLSFMSPKESLCDSLLLSKVKT